MCGIAAIFSYGSTAPGVDRDEIEAITERMRPRGPDAGGAWISPDSRVALGARRLAIIDLTDEGTQPMADVDDELRIVFNGEIYNYRELRARLERLGARFHSTTDTEVLLQLYRHDGANMVELLRGMFAFAIWDTRTRRMFVARDPYGIKPLYIADDGQTFRAASTVKALLAGGRVGRRRDLAGIAGFWLMGTVPEPYTIYESIRAVEAGTSLCVDERGIHDVRRHYSIAATLLRGAHDVAAARLVHPPTLLRELVTDSLRHHLVSDVPVGAFLSSGIDSSALVALATEANGQPLRTVTLRFGEFLGRESDEAPLAERFARGLGSDHVTRLVTRDEFNADLPRLFDAMDQPTIDGTNTWFVSKGAAERGLKVAISGLGGDELFGSYPSFRDLPRIVNTARLPFAAMAARRLARSPKAGAVALYGGTWAGAYLLKRGLFLPDDLPSLMGAEEAQEGLDRLAMPYRIRTTIDPDPGTSFGRVAALEASLYMRNQLLRDTDWASMAHSLEVRTPLVDASLLRQIAPLLMVEKQRCKGHFAQSPCHPLPVWLAARKKTGFSVPLVEWMGLQPDGTSTRMRSWAHIVMERWA
ncbi:MAG TPA: asparagine synthase (glutamine-hydrolyzing) [Thermoanaerobaculia bacterium]|jgi:asparagine synthase (glutamine-hydrolysing)|nr:asparagine synthase (glutamine-hydrolyzing) [Thermoanaerobaculia bacterium]